MRAITSVSHCHKQHQLRRPRRPPRPLQLRSFCNNALLTILSTPLLESLFSTGPFWKGLQYSVHFSPLFSTKSTNGVHLPRMSLLEANNKRMILRMEEEQQRKIAQAVEARKQFPYQLIRTQEIEEDSLLLRGRK